MYARTLHARRSGESDADNLHREFERLPILYPNNSATADTRGENPELCTRRVGLLNLITTDLTITTEINHGPNKKWNW